MKTEILGFVLAVGCMTVGCMNYEQRLKECDWVGEFKEGYALCEQDDKYFFIDPDGKRTSDKYDKASEFANGYAVAYDIMENGAYRFVILDKDFDKKYYPVHGVCGQVNQWGKLWVNATGDAFGWTLLDVATGDLSPMCGYPDWVGEDGTAVVSRRCKDSTGTGGYYEYAICDGQGHEIVPFGRYSFIGNFSNGLAQFSTTGYFHFNPEHLFDASNYEKDKQRCRDLSTRQRSPSADIRLGYIDCKGNVVIPEGFHTAGVFSKAGYARVSTGSYDHNRRFYVIDGNGRDCTGEIMAEASLLGDGQWKSGKLKSGECILANNAGETISLGTGCDIAYTRGYVMTRKGTQYKIYRVNESGDDVEQIGSFSRSRSGEVVVVYTSVERRERTDYIRFFNQKATRSWGMRESPYDQYLPDGTLVDSGWDTLYSRTYAGGPERIRFPEFTFF